VAGGLGGKAAAPTGLEVVSAAEVVVSAAEVAVPTPAQIVIFAATEVVAAVDVAEARRGKG